MRIIVTGSRDWNDANMVYAKLDCHGATLVVEGGCKTGADLHARKWTKERGIVGRTFAADWDQHGLAAGPIRNQEMVDAGADLCLAFFQRPDSKGTSDCVRRAGKVGIPVIRYGDYRLREIRPEGES